MAPEPCQKCPSVNRKGSKLLFLFCYYAIIADKLRTCCMNIQVVILTHFLLWYLYICSVQFHGCCLSHTLCCDSKVYRSRTAWHASTLSGTGLGIKLIAYACVGLIGSGLACWKGLKSPLTKLLLCRVWDRLKVGIATGVNTNTLAAEETVKENLFFFFFFLMTNGTTYMG